MDAINESVLGDLEVSCPFCRGVSQRDSARFSEGTARCRKCGGAGYVPTEVGKRILSLMKHNLWSMLKDAQEDWRGEAGHGRGEAGHGGKRDRSDIAKLGDSPACPYCQ